MVSARLSVAAFLLAAHPSIAIAQQTPEPQSITLSPQEYTQIIVQLAARDPLIAMLMQKQREAQAAAAKTKPPTPATPDEQR